MFKLDERLAKDCFQLGESALNLLLLMNDQHYPWFILVPKRANIREIFELPEADQRQLIKESSLLSQQLSTTFKADKLNIAALGNQVAQLHIHHIVRFTTDAAWPGPVWGVHTPAPYSDETKAQLVTRLTQTALHEAFNLENE